MQKNTEQTFENFTEYPENRLAYRLAVYAVEKPGSFNPIILYGPSQTGKSHLLCAVENAVRSQNAWKSILHVSAFEFLNTCMAAAEEGLYKELIQTYQSADYLLIENIEDLMYKEASQQLMANVISTAVRDGHQLMMTSIVDPRDLKILDGGILKDCTSAVYAGIPSAKTNGGIN